ncbi:hypothetical protein BN131_11 [Cronobacter malonaticus 681]|nr:hypothetical protein BN131_11 [Cronobacter malonaticus 681]
MHRKLAIRLSKPDKLSMLHTLRLWYRISSRLNQLLRKLFSRSSKAELCLI